MRLISRIQVAVFLFLMIFGSSKALFSQEINSELPEFSELKVFNGVEVVLIPAEENRISITGHSKEKVKFELVENRLEIRLSLENIWSDDNTLITVYSTNTQIVDANEGSIVEVKEVLEGASLSFRSQEGAAIYAPVKASRVTAKAVTGGLVQLRGETDELVVDVNTGGKYFGEQLQGKEATATVGTAGQADVNSSGYLKATARFGGVINVYGNPDNLDSKTSLGGKISRKN